MKTVSIITPCYNSEEFIFDCLTSVQKLIKTSDFEIEHIFIDDCSTDSTRSLLESVNFLNLKKLMLSKNVGAAAARNYGISQSSGDYLFCLDADDVIFQNSIKYLFETAEKLAVEWVYSDFLRGNDTLRYLIGDDYHGWNFSNIPDLICSLLTGEHFFQHNSLFSRKIFLKVGGYDETIRVAHDFDLMVRFLLEKCMPTFLPGPLYIHRFHSHNLSREHSENKDLHRKDIEFIFRKYETQVRNILNKIQIKKVEKYLNLSL